MSRRLIRVLAVYLFVLVLSAAWPQQPPPMSSLDRGRAQDMLQVIAGDVKKHYYDPKFHGIDFNAKVAEAKQKIEKETSFNMAMSHIAAALDSLDDSHTFFLPPQHAYKHAYGMQYQMVGDKCFVTQVRPKSDAEAKGVKPGDQILTIFGTPVDRDDLWKLQFVFSVLRPRPVIRLALQDPSGSKRELEVAAKMRQLKRISDLTGGGGGSDIWDMVRDEESQEHLMRARTVEYGDKVTVLKVPEFDFSLGEVENMLGRARKHENLVVDLRGNPGGSIETLKYLVGGELSFRN